jgi:hypothetical protein
MGSEKRSGVTLAILIAALIGLNGCVALDPYVEPEGLPSANLRLKVSQPPGFRYCVVAATVNYGTCLPANMIGAISCRTEIDDRRLSIPGAVSPRDGVLERKVPSGELFSIAPYMIFMDIPVGDLIKNVSKYTGVRLGSCIVPSFVPEAGKHYELNFSPSPGQCKISLSEIQEDGRLIDITEEQVKSVELISNNNNAGSLFCEEKSGGWVE